MKRQIKTSLFERLLLSSGDENKAKVLDLALKGNEINKASDIVKDPYVFEFLGLPEEKLTYVDMVFYNKLLKSYVLIELKTGNLMPEAVGQLNM